jgi:pimeloyl-ACP methyl ester carboxylesterase
MSEEGAALWYSSADGLSLFCRRFRAAAGRTPLLCVHDIGQTSRVFRPLARVISQTRRVLIPDLRGHGRSDFAIDLAGYTIDRLAQDVMRLLDIEDITTCAVIGSGLGGHVALRLAASRPDSISAMMLCEWAPDLCGPALLEAVKSAEQAALGTWAAAEQALPGARLILRDHEGRPDCDWDPLAPQRLLSSMDVPKVRALLEAVNGMRLAVLRGARSRLVGDAAFATLLSRRADLTQVTIGGSADMRAPGSPAAIGAISRFLAAGP